MITYDIQFDLDRDGLFANPSGHIANRLLSANWALGVSNSFLHLAQPMVLQLTISDPDLTFSQDVGRSPFGVPLRDMMVRIQATVDGYSARTLVTGWITDVRSADIAYGTATQIIVEDRMNQLQNAEYLPVFKTDTRVDEEIQNVFDSALIAYPYLKSFWILDASLLDISTILFEQTITEFEQALTTLGFAGDSTDEGRGVSALGYISQILQAEKGGRLFVDRTGKFVFHNRYHDVQANASDTFDAGEFVQFDLVQGEVYNDITINYVPRSLGVAGTVLYSAQNLPFVIYANSSRKIVGRYYDLDEPSSTVGGSDVIDPVAGTDYIAQDTLTGQTVTSSLLWQFEIGGTGTSILISNPTDSNITVTKLQIRGTPVFTYQTEQVQHINPASIYKYGRIHFPLIVAPFINTEVIAQAYANQLGARYAEPDQRYETIAFILGSQDTPRDGLSERVLGLRVGDVVRIQNEVTGHDKTYAIAGEDHAISGAVHRVQWVLRPSTRTKAWVLGRDSLDIDTILAF